MKFRSIITLVFALALLLLPACTRPASTVYPKTTDIPSEFPVSTEATQAVVEKVVSPSAEPTKHPATSVPQVKEKSPTPEPVSSETAVAPVLLVTPVEQYLTPSVPEATASEPVFPVFSGYGDGYPTIGIRGVVYNETVTIQANDFPAAVTYTVTMSRTDTNGVGAVEVATMETGEGGTFFVTFNIPEDLLYVGSIAIRIDFSSGEYTLNWFYNITTN